MKKKIIIILTGLILLAFSVAVYAYTNHSNHNKSASCCAKADCCKDGKCQMNGDCCKNHDSCPMKGKENKENAENTKECPIHKKEGEAKSKPQN